MAELKTWRMLTRRQVKETNVCRTRLRCMIIFGRVSAAPQVKSCSVTVSAVMANRRRRAIARNITFATGWTRRKRKRKTRLTSLRKSDFWPSPIRPMTQWPSFSRLATRVAFLLSGSSSRKDYISQAYTILCYFGDFDSSTMPRVKGMNSREVIRRVSIVVNRREDRFRTSAFHNDATTNFNSRGDSSSPLSCVANARATHAHVCYTRISRVSMARSFEMLQYGGTVSIVSVIDRGDRDRTNGNSEAS